MQTNIMGILTWWAVITNAVVNVLDLGEIPGIYFERLRDVYFTKTTWKIIIGIDLTNSWFNEAHYKRTLKIGNATCNARRWPGQCKNIHLTHQGKNRPSRKELPGS